MATDVKPAQGNHEPAQKSPKPERKVNAAGVGGATATVLLWIVTTFTGVQMDAAVAAALVTVATYALGYFVPNPD